ncbi:Prolyl endopeptidase [Vitis vinifera]|uniref:prolyl oligopeptidase n=1 Tax=Vitis vinifera TaxID=29760 RepID=A0A438ETD1_VITVI|nr:Prolyl endopeptidase [Vitis vinifera]
MFSCSRNTHAIFYPLAAHRLFPPYKYKSSSFRFKHVKSSFSSYFSFYSSSHSRSSSSNPRMGSVGASGESLKYPLARRDESVVDDYHGVLISDPYRWLEDPDAQEVKEFVEKQVKLTDSVLQTRGDKYFYFHNTGLQAQKVLYVQDSLDGKAEVLLDPNGLSEDGTVSLNTCAVSEDAKYLAYGLSSSGSDWVTIKVMRVEDKRVETDTLSWVKFSGISWTHDSKGFFYCRYPAPSLFCREDEKLDAGTETNSNLNQELYYHFLGTDQSQDILCWKDPDNPKHMFGADVTDDGKMEEVGRLLCCLDGKIVRVDEEDRVRWMDSKDGVFSPKISFFMWEASWGRVLTLDRLQKRGWALANKCFLCQRVGRRLATSSFIVKEQGKCGRCSSLFLEFFLGLSLFGKGNPFRMEGLFCGQEEEGGITTGTVMLYVLLYISESCEEVNKVYHCDITSLPEGLEGFRERKDLLPFIKLIDNFDARYHAIANDDTLFTFMTNKDAPKYKLVQVDLKEPSIWNVVLEEAEKDVLESAYAVNGNQILVCYLSDVKYVLQIRDLKTGSLLHDLPIDIGSVFDISARRRDSTVFIGFTSFLTPGIIYHCNLEAGVPEMKIFREIVVPGFDRTEFCVDQVVASSLLVHYSPKSLTLWLEDRSWLLEQFIKLDELVVLSFRMNDLLGGVSGLCDLPPGDELVLLSLHMSSSWLLRYSCYCLRCLFNVFVPSKDGTKIPMFIVARKNIPMDGSHPCLLYGYGGFNISITPSFSVSRIVLSRHLGAVFCIANIRGGGEYGQEWHKSGSLAKKQNCFDDFISAAEYLVSAGYTQPRKLCIEGGSNGGLLVGACINQRPDLFGCALAHVGVMDMLRFHKFTIGHAWTSDYGCSEKEEEFHWLIKYSPLHNVRRPWEQSPDQPSQYPATMILTADHDDRVVPLHSLKLLATMQYILCTSVEKSPQTNPIIGRIECKAGHGAGRPTQKMIDEAADRYSFLAKMLEASWIE